MPELLRAEFEDARVWKSMVASIEKVIDEAVFLFTEEGLRLRALDTSHVVMVDLYYPSSSFSTYNIEGEVGIGISFDTLSKILKRATKRDALLIRFDGSIVEISFTGRGERKFRFPQIELTLEKLPEPKIEFTVKFKMLSSVFREAIKDLGTIGDTLSVRAFDGEDRILMSSRGDIGEAEIDLSIESQSLLDVAIESPDSSTYSIEYFDMMLQAAQAADIVGFSYSADAPARVDMEYQAGGRLTFYVSPRVE